MSLYCDWLQISSKYKLTSDNYLLHITIQFSSEKLTLTCVYLMYRYIHAYMYVCVYIYNCPYIRICKIYSMYLKTGAQVTN